MLLWYDSIVPSLFTRVPATHSSVLLTGCWGKLPRLLGKIQVLWSGILDFLGFSFSRKKSEYFSCPCRMVFLSLESLEKEWFMKRNIFRNKFLFLDLRSENSLVGKAHLVGFFAPLSPTNVPSGLVLPEPSQVRKRHNLLVYTRSAPQLDLAQKKCIIKVLQ